MSKSDHNQTSLRISYKSLGLAVGMIFGGLVGLLSNNLVIFAGDGMLLGLAIGTALESRR